jgi:hypothetical protein
MGYIVNGNVPTVIPVWKSCILFVLQMMRSVHKDRASIRFEDLTAVTPFSLVEIDRNFKAFILFWEER